MSMKRPPAFGTSWGRTFLLFTLFFFALLAPLWLLSVGPVWDANDYYYPIFTYLADSIREGRLSLWDPYTNSGEPFHADPQKMVLSPLALLLGFALNNTFLGFILMWLIHWWCGGMGMLWLARYFKATPSGAMVAAASYALSGFFLSHAEHTPYIIVAAWLPWILGFADMAVMRSRVWCALMAAFFLSLSALSGGYPMLIAFTGISVALWLLLRFILLGDPELNSGRTIGNRVLWTAGTLVLMAVISAAVWSPILHAFLTESTGFTDRLTAVKSETSLYAESFSWRSALSLFFPYASILLPIEWMRADVSMTNAYTGVFAVPLALVWFLKSDGKKRHWWLLIFAVFMVLVSLGGKTGLRIVLNELFPPLRLMRFNAPFRLFWMLPLALSAGLGFSILRSNIANRRLFFNILLAWTGFSLVVAYVVKVCALDNGIMVMNTFPHIYLPALAVIPVGLALTFSWLKWDSHATANAIPQLLAVLILADMGGHLYINSYTVWTKGSIINYFENLHVRSTGTNGPPVARSSSQYLWPMNAHIVIKKPVVTGYVAFNNSDFNKTLSNSRFFEVLASPYRFWLVPGVEPLRSRLEMLQSLTETGSNNPVPIFVENPTRLISPYRVVAGTYGALQVNRYAPEEILLQVYVPGSDGAFLASTERYAPGWKVRVDGVPTPVEKTNLFFRGVYIPQGQHTIAWNYLPDRWNYLAGLSYIVLIFTLGSALFLRCRNKGQNGITESPS